MLFGAGGVAVLVGFGTLAYRRRLSRKFAANHPDPRDPASPDPRDPASPDQADRDSAPRDPASR